GRPGPRPRARAARLRLDPGGEGRRPARGSGGRDGAMTTAGDTVKERYLADFAAFTRSGGASGPGWLTALREEAIARFAERGFPTVREEGWRYASVAPVVEHGFRLPGPASANGLGAEIAARFAVGGAGWSRLVFVNGGFAPKLSAIRPLPGGAWLTTLAEA